LIVWWGHSLRLASAGFHEFPDSRTYHQQQLSLRLPRLFDQRALISHPCCRRWLAAIQIIERR
jgi:hypothetical protein